VLRDGQIEVVESKGLRRLVGKSVQKTHAFGERMAADVEEGAAAWSGPSGSISILGKSRLWHSGKPSWKGTGRSAIAAVSRDRSADAIDGTPAVWGIDQDGALCLQRGDTWESVAGFEAGLVLKNSVLALAPAPTGVYALREEGLYRIPGANDPAALVAPTSSTKGARLETSTSGVVALRSVDGAILLVSPTGETTSLEGPLPDPFAVDDSGRVWAVDGAKLVLFSNAGPKVEVVRQGELKEVVAIVVQGGGPPRDRLIR
jgi:hypothetical protein